MAASLGYGIILNSKNVKEAVAQIFADLPKVGKNLLYLNMSVKHYEGLSDEAKKFVEEFDIPEVEPTSGHIDDIRYAHLVNYLDDHYPLLNVAQVGIADTAIVVANSHQETYEYGFLDPSAVTEEERNALEQMMEKISYTMNPNWIFWNSEG